MTTDYEKLEQATALISEVMANLEQPGVEYPIPADQLVWKNGNLWKPESESDGRLVVLLRSDWPVPDRVEVLRKTGAWEIMRYAGSDSNENRHHYRGRDAGTEYAPRKQGGGCRVYYKEEFGLIPLPGPGRGRYE